jgi:hypothetical protein
MGPTRFWSAACLACVFIVFAVPLLLSIQANSIPRSLKQKKGPDVCGGATYKRFKYWREWLPLVYPSGQTNPGPIYEFGVYKGKSMLFLRNVPQFKNSMMYGFDSFEGLPDEAPEAGEQKNWPKGSFNAGDIRQKLLPKLGGPSKVKFVKGFYNETLTPELVKENKMMPAAYVDIDADLYVSSKQALTWVFEHGLAVPGTFFGYDDWWINPCSPGGENLSPLETSEGKAHAEIANEFGVVFRCVAGGCQASPSCQASGTIFVVEKIMGKGMSGGDHGFHMTASEIQEYQHTDLQCKQIRKDYKHAGFNRKRIP